jgi:protein-S-isoprenylcysteine O-methyltransferase Ste14
MAEGPDESGASHPDTQDHADVLVLPPLLYGGALLAGILVKWGVGGSIAPGSTLRPVLGAGLLAAGVLISLWFSRAFAQAGQDRNPRTPTPGLVTGGLYRYSRNPAYVALTIIQIGLGLLLDNVWILAALIPVLAVMHQGVILREEAYLERRFGDEYRAYKASVRRWL